MDATRRATRAEAEASVSASARERVLECFREHGPMTADECAERLGMVLNTARARCTELAGDGQLVETGERRRTAAGRSAAVLDVRKSQGMLW